MRSVTVLWQSGDERFVAEGTHRGHAISINAPHEGPVAGFSATELLLAGIGGCAAWDVVEILRKQRQDVAGLEVEVIGTQAADPPWEYRQLELRFTARGTGLMRAAVERAVDLSIDRYCSVLATVRGVEVTRSVELLEEAPPVAGAGSGSPSPSAAGDIRAVASARTEG